MKGPLGVGAGRVADVGKMPSKDIAQQMKGAFPNMGKALSGLTKGMGQIGTIALGVGAGIAIFKAIKGLLSKLVSISPQLDRTMSIFKKSFEFILRPIGDIISLILRPFALMMLRFAIPFYKKAREFIETMKEAFTVRKLIPREEGLKKLGEEGLEVGEPFRRGIRRALAPRGVDGPVLQQLEEEWAHAPGKPTIVTPEEAQQRRDAVMQGLVRSQGGIPLFNSEDAQLAGRVLLVVAP